MKVFALIIAALFLLTGCYTQKETITTISEENKELVYVFHGLGRTELSMWLLSSRLEDAGFSVKTIGYQSLIASPDEILKDVSPQIIRSDYAKHPSVHFVGHSLGGLIIRAYLDSNRVDNMGRVVLIGTPNKGTAFIDEFSDTWWLKILGTTVISLGEDTTSFPNSIGDPYYPVGIIAGISEIINNDLIIPGIDDGIVTLESAKLKGMTDMIIFDSSHTMLKNHQEVADYTVKFLKTGRFFDKDAPIKDMPDELLSE